MKRRHFLFSLAAPVLAQRAQPSAPVVVVGGGLAGLRTAGLLLGAGQRVIVLEARAGPGGRVRTIRAPFDDDLYAEAGAIRISGAHQRVLQLARDYHLPLVPFAAATGAALVNVAGAVFRSPDELGKLASRLSLTPEEAGRTPGALLQKYLGGLPPDLGDPQPPATAYARWQPFDRVSWPDWLRSRGASPGAVTLMTLGGDSRDLSALYVLRQIALLQKSDQFYKIQGGMDRLPKALAVPLGSNIRYGAAVMRIESGPTSMAVQYRANDRVIWLQARRVVLAIPFSTLRRVVLTPALPAGKAAAVAALPYFPAVRFLLQSKSRFWEDAGLSGAARTDQPAETWDCTYDFAGDRGVLGATAGGVLGERVASLTQAQATKFGVDLVARTFPKMASQFEKGTVIRWASDPWLRGAFAVFHPGQMTTIMPGITQAEGRLHFAGEHTSPWMGWMEGALESGERAAREVLAAEGA